jgi:hypothetical protein
LFFYVLFLTWLAQKTLSVIRYSPEELLDIRETSTYQHDDQEYNFPKADPLSAPPRPTQNNAVGGEVLERSSSEASDASTPPTASEYITRSCQVPS